MSESIRFECPSCKKTYQVPAAHRGKKVRCAQCRETAIVSDEPSKIAVPTDVVPPKSIVKKAPAAGQPRPVTQSEHELLAEILAGFQGPIAPVRANAFYQFAIIVVLMFVVLLPVVYVALIGLAGWSVYYHATEHVGMFQNIRSGRGTVFMFLLYVAPIISGVILVLFMFKPLLARPLRDDRRRSLLRDGQPLIFAFVDKICDAVHAPRPKRIDVDYSVNASASFRSGFWSFFRRADLVLTVGLPLVATMSLKQFAGILAHEFGHFTQGVGMRASYVVRHVNHWFARVVYQRDQWDQWLIETSEELDVRIGIIFYLARFCVFLTRLVLMVLMFISHAASSALLRQMEYSADLHEGRLVGSKTFAQSCKQLVYANVCAGPVVNRVFEGHVPPEEFPLELSIVVEKLDADERKKIDKKVKKMQTGWFDTHPSDTDRIAYIKSQVGEEGVFHSDLPATKVFRNFKSMCETVVK